MFSMNAQVFEEIQRECCWFTLPIFDNVPDIDPSINIIDKEIWRNDVCVQRHIFAMIFGAFGYRRKLATASALIAKKLEELQKEEPQDQSMDNPIFARWIGLFARYYILWGTVFAYQGDYVLAAQCMMNGLKTRAINLFMPYCDFIRYVLSEVEKMPAEITEYEGCGFSADDPMGSINFDGGTLLPGAAEMIISALEGNDGEIILAHNGNTKYGTVRRVCSTSGKKGRNCIDVYEALAVGRHCKLQKIRFYFNGYFTAQNRYRVKLPAGFSLDPLSRAAQFFEVVD